jgi:nitroimidazol reductase NimA-like FMN-containing flavoprotein (pyridoxamine 5'-phosphate oxidase superfamily)
MPAPTKRQVTDAEKEAFIASNKFGVLCFSGDKPYAVPVAYKYFKGAMIFVMVRTGRKFTYINKSKNVCFNIWQMGDQITVPGLKDLRYVSVLLEGVLDEIKPGSPDWSFYELPAPPPGVNLSAWKLNTSVIGATAATQPTK